MLNDDRAGEIADNLSGRQRRGLLDAYMLSGPSGDQFVTDAGDRDALYAHDEELVTWTGRLLPFGLAVRRILEEAR